MDFDADPNVGLVTSLGNGSTPIRHVCRLSQGCVARGEIVTRRQSFEETVMKVVIALVVWFAVAALLGILVGKMIRGGGR